MTSKEIISIIEAAAFNLAILMVLWFFLRSCCEEDDE